MRSGPQSVVVTRASSRCAGRRLRPKDSAKRAPGTATAYAAGQFGGMITGGIVCVLWPIFLVNGGKPKDKS